MKRVKDILPKKADLDARVQGDALGVASDWRSLEALAEATRKRFEEDGSDEAKERYLKVMEALLPLVGVDVGEDFRKRHHELVGRLAPGSLAEKALGGVPSLGPAPKWRKLAERLDLDGYQAPDEDPENEAPWVEADEPRKTSGTPRIPAGAEAA